MSTRSSRRGKLEKQDMSDEEENEIEATAEADTEMTEEAEQTGEPDQAEETDQAEEPEETNNDDNDAGKDEEEEKAQEEREETTLEEGSATEDNTQEEDKEKEEIKADKDEEGKEEETETNNDKEEENAEEPKAKPIKRATSPLIPESIEQFGAPLVVVDPQIQIELDIIKNNPPSTPLEFAMIKTLKRKDLHIDRLSGEIQKLKAFISKRKQTYKRKRKDEGAPTRALSAYNIFVQDRFSQLAKENEEALKSADTDAVLKRVPPASLVATTGNQWKELSSSDKSVYEERAREDRKRYEDQMAKYQPPDKTANRKRNKTGYNMFFSAHVLRLKQSEAGVPSERGSVARLVGNAWKVSLCCCVYLH